MDYDRCLEDRSAIAAADRLAAMVRISEQTTTDHLWISVLVASNVIFGTFDRARDFVKGELVTPAAAKVVLAAYKRIRLEDMFGWVEAMEQTRWEWTQWPRGVCTGEQAGAVYLDKLGQLDWSNPALPQMLLVSRNERQLAGDLDRLDGYFAKVMPLWKDAANDVKLRELEVEAAEGQFGLMAAVRAPEMEQTRRSMLRARRQVEQLVRELGAYVRRAEGRGP